MSNHTLNVGTNIVHQCPDSQLGSTSNNITISPSTSSGTINQDDIRHSLTCILNRFTEIIQRTYIYACDNKKKKIVNGHDIKICDCSVFNPGLNISGGVSIGSRCLIGTGATILQYIEIGSDVLVGAGSVVNKNVTEGGAVAGMPARLLIKRIKEDTK